MQFKKTTYTFLQNKCWYIPNGLSYQRNVEISESRDACRKRLGIPDDKNLCILLGWDLKRKGIDIAIKAINECQKKDSSVWLGIIGLSSNPQEWQLNVIKELTGVDPKSDWIKYLDGTEDMYAYHRASDVFLSTSRKEACPYGVIEAASQNKPIVASDIPATFWAHKYDKCFVYPMEDPIKCSEMVLKAVQAKNDSSNYEEIIKQFDINLWCQRVIEIYNKI